MSGGNTFTFKLSDIGEGITEAEIAEWHVKVGDVVDDDDPIVDMLTDKAAVELSAPVAGTVQSIHGEPGDSVAVGAPLVVFAVDGDVPEPEPEPEAAPEAATASAPDIEKSDEESGESAPQATVPAQSPNAAPPRDADRRSGGGDRPKASPATRKRAREMGIDLWDVQGSGPNGRVLREDLETSVGGGHDGQGSAGTGLRKRTGTREIKVIGLRRKIAEAMQRSKQRIPHFAYVEELDVTELEALRVHLNATRRDDQPKLTLLPFLMRAIVNAVPEFPAVNATFDDEAGVVTQYDAVHCGIATQTPGGLVVPVVHHAETLDIWQSADAIKTLAEAARGGKASRQQLSGSSITISSLGPMGGIASTPVINAPEVGIVGVNKMVTRPMYVNGAVVPRQIMNLSSSFDHRIVDGWDAAAFIQRVKALLEHPATLFM